MAAYDNYALRVYRAKDIYGNDVENGVPDDDILLTSPYVGQGNNIFGAHKKGKIAKERGFSDFERDFLDDTNILTSNMRGASSLGMYDKYGHYILPHKGISVLRTADPKYSLYSLTNIAKANTHVKKNTNLFEKNGNGLYTVNHGLLRMLPYDNLAEINDDIMQLPKHINLIPNDPVKEYDEKNADDDYDFTPLVTLLDKLAIENGIGKYGSVTFDPKQIEKYGYKLPKDFDAFTNAANEVYQDNILRSGFAPKATFIGIPSDYHNELNKFFKQVYGKEVAKNTDYTAPDYVPKEGKYANLVRAMTDVMTGFDAPIHRLYVTSMPTDAFYTTDDVLKGELRAQRDYPEELVVNRLKPVEGYTFKDVAKKMDNLNALFSNRYNVSDEDKDKMAQQFIYDTFKIDPIKMSDKSMKRIYKDLSDDVAQRDTQSNVLSALKGGLI